MVQKHYVDLEYLLVNQYTCLNNPNKSHATNIAQHIPSGYSINVVRNHNNSSVVTYYRKKDCIQKLCEELKKKLEENCLIQKKPMTSLTPEQEKKHNDSDKCYTCQRKLNNNKKITYYRNF